MKVLHIERDVGGRNGEWVLDIYGDTHLGSKSVDEKLLRKHVDETKESGREWVHLGDAIDGIVPPDRRFNKQNLADWAKAAFLEDNLIQEEWDEFQRVFNPIRERGLFVLDGDGKHNQSRDVADCFSRTLGVMDIEGGYPACHLLITFSRGSSTQRKRVELVFHHGWFAGRMKGGKVNNLVQALSIYPGAWGFFCGHGHDKSGVRVDSLIVEEYRQKQWVRRAAMTGAYLQTYAHDTVGYGEVKGYAPAGLGRMTVTVRPFCDDPEKRIELSNM